MECNIIAGSNGDNSSEPTTVCRAYAALPRKNRSVIILSISIEDKTCTIAARSIYRRGRGGYTFRTLNG
jgi:hypothetical protein